MLQQLNADSRLKDSSCYQGLRSRWNGKNQPSSYISPSCPIFSSFPPFDCANERPSWWHQFSPSVITLAFKKQSGPDDQPSQVLRSTAVESQHGTWGVIGSFSVCDLSLLHWQQHRSPIRQRTAFSIAFCICRWAEQHHQCSAENTVKTAHEKQCEHFFFLFSFNVLCVPDVGISVTLFKAQKRPSNETSVSGRF